MLAFAGLAEGSQETSVRLVLHAEVCDPLTFEVPVSSYCHRMRLDRGLAEAVGKTASKASVDLLSAGAEEHEEWTQETVILSVKRLNGKDIDMGSGTLWLHLQK